MVTPGHRAIVNNNSRSKNRSPAEVFLRSRHPPPAGPLAKVPMSSNRGHRRNTQPRGRPELVFFTPDITDVSTSKRAQGFLDYGFRLTVFGFRRDRYNRRYEPTWPWVALGRTEDGNYWQRVRALLSCIPVLIANRWRLRGAAVIYARNIDQLVLALLTHLLFARRARFAYEVLDIQPMLVAASPIARSLRRM